jgi:hypothetical protein
MPRDKNRSIQKPSMAIYKDTKSYTPFNRPSGALWFWSAAGVAIISLFINNWIRWLQSPDFVAADPGPDPYPYLKVLRATEFLSVVLFIFIGNHTVIKPWVRNGRPNLDGNMFIGGVFASTLDIVFAVFNPTWAMNSYAVAFGSWSNFIPGWPSPGASKVPWGLLWCLPAYIWLGVGAAILGCSFLDRLRKQWLHTPDIFFWILLQIGYMCIFTCLAMFWNRTQVYTYVSVPRNLSVWYCETYQLPIYEPFLIGMYCMGYTWLRDTRDSNGRCAIDREVDQLPFNTLTKELLSILAVCGWAAATTMFGYMIPFSWLGMFGEGHPTLPSYLTSGIYCGQPNGPICPGQHLAQLRLQELRGPN